MADSVGIAGKGKNALVHSPESVLRLVQFIHFKFVQVLMQMTITEEAIASRRVAASVLEEVHHDKHSETTTNA
jgi:hypothetical protein